MTKDCSLIYQFSTWKLQAQNIWRTCCVHKLFWMSKQKQKSICVHNMFSPCSELVVFLYWIGESMNNVLAYCGLVHARINASDKDLPVPPTYLYFFYLFSFWKKTWWLLQGSKEATRYCVSVKKHQYFKSLVKENLTVPYYYTIVRGKFQVNIFS